MIDDIIFNLFRYGDNLKHGQCTDGKIINNWTGSCTPPGKNRGGGYVRVELRVDGFSSISVRTAPALPEGGSPPPPPGSALGGWPPVAAKEWGDCSSPSAAFETVTMRLAEPSRLMLNVVASSGGKLLVEVLLPTTRPSSEGTAAAAAAAAAAGAGGGAAAGGGGGLLSPPSPSVLAGYSAANCTEIVGDYTSVVVEWDGGEVLPKGVVSLRFLLFGEVDVYSFWFESESVDSKAT